MAHAKGLAERYEELERRRAELVHKAPHAPSPVHVQTVRVLTELLEMGRLFSTQRVPAPLRAMMRMLHKMEPELVKELAHVPPEQIREFLHDLMVRLATIVDEPREAYSPRHDKRASELAPGPARDDQPGEDQPQTA